MALNYIRLFPFSMRLYPLSIVIVCGLLDPASKWQLLSQWVWVQPGREWCWPVNKKALCTLIDTGTLQIFSGTLTEITCLADSAVPVFHLVEQERVYNSRDYNQLPDLFGIDSIEARVSPNRDNITLYISGTNRSNNVTVMCRNEDVLLGRDQILFTLMLEFVSKFINQTWPFCYSMASF